MSKQYNLRSTKPDSIQLPVQVQLCDDGEFMTHLLSTGSDIVNDKQMGHDSSSESELDCSAVVGASDSDDPSINASRTFDKYYSEKVPSTSTSDQTAQTMVNHKILEQLTSIGKRLDALEKSNCKKSVDKSKIKSKRAKVVVQKVPTSTHSQSVDTVTSQGVSTASTVTGTQTNSHTLPSLSSIRQNANIQHQVDQRIHELSVLAKTGTDSKIKSQRGGPVEVYIKNKVKWPHEYVLAGLNKERVSYDQLTMGQWMAGFCRTMRDEPDPKNRACMLDYLIALLDDSNDFSWSAAKSSHAVLLCCMEQGEIEIFSCTDQIDRVRRAHAQRHVVGAQNFEKNFSKKTKAVKSMPCQYFNAGSCLHAQTHETKGVLYKHMCSACLTKNGKNFPHPEVECRKNKQTKNE